MGLCTYLYSILICSILRYELWAPPNPRRLDKRGLTVCLFSAEPPVFVAFRPASTFKAGDMVVSLECAGSGDPEPDVQWLRLPEAVAIPSPAFPNYVSVSFLRPTILK